MKLKRCRIGIHSGNVMSGNIGAPTRMKFGLVGDPVNLSSRLEGIFNVLSLIWFFTKENI